MLCRGYGWTLETCEALSEIEIYQALEDLYRIQKDEYIRDLNKMAFSTAAGMGSKAAHAELKKLTNQHTHQEKARTTQVLAPIPLCEVIDLGKQKP